MYSFLPSCPIIRSYSFIPPSINCFIHPAASRVLDNIDASVKPCENFYQFACGKWKRTNVIPEDKSGQNVFGVLRDSVQVINKCKYSIIVKLKTKGMTRIHTQMLMLLLLLVLVVLRLLMTMMMAVAVVMIMILILMMVMVTVYGDFDDDDDNDDDDNADEDKVLFSHEYQYLRHIYNHECVRRMVEEAIYGCKSFLNWFPDSSHI